MKTRIIRSFQGNTMYLQGIMNGFKDEDLLLSTGESNTIGWIFGHMILYRGQILKELKKEYQIKDGEDQFKRGSVKNKNLKVSFEGSFSDYIKRGEEICSAVNELDENEFMRPMNIQVRGKDVDLEAYLSMLAWHETFHIGQIDLIKVATGKEGIK